MERLGSRKGVMFSLVTLVIVVLLLGEVLTYLYTNTQYSSLGAQEGQAQAAGMLYSQIRAQAPSFLQASLTDAVYALNAYEMSSAVNRTVGSGAYALQSLMDNGTIYGTNMNGYMGGYTLSAYANSVGVAAAGDGFTVSMPNANAVVFQASPGRISASFSTQLNVSSPYGTVSYPITANASIPISGLPDLFGGDLGTGAVVYSPNSSQLVNANYLAGGEGSIYSAPNNALAQLKAVSGSRSPYLFAYGSLYIDSNILASCSDVSGVPNKGNEILATSNSYSLNGAGNACGFAGLVTNAVNPASPPLVPYLVYSPNVISYLRPGASYLLDGNSLSLYDMAGLQAAVWSGSYAASSSSPTYLSLIGGSRFAASPYGVAPLGLASRQVASFTGASNVIALNVPVNAIAGGLNSVSFWVQWPGNQVSAMVPFSSNSYSIYVSGGSVGFGSGGSYMGTPTYGTSEFGTTPWVHIVATFSNGFPANDLLYVNGVRQALTAGGFPSSAAMGNSIAIGGAGPGSYLTGQVADVQVYNAVLTPFQAYSLYLGGINSGPVNYSTLAGWWPLNGNANDYSRYHDNGTANALYSRLSGYAGDTLDGGSFYRSPVSGVEGVSQCYSRGACAWGGPGKVYAAVPQAYATNTVQAVGSLLGSANITIPASAYFNAAENAYYIASRIPLNTISAGYDTISFWMDFVPNAITATAPVYFGGGYGVVGTSTCFGIGTGSTVHGIAASTVANRWVNIVAVLSDAADPSSGSSTLYVNGTSKPYTCGSALSGGSAPGITTVYLGGEPGASAGFSGSIADVQVYNTVLTSIQAQQLYLNNTVPNLKPAGWWPLSTGSNQTGALAGNVAVEWAGGQICTVANSLGIIGSPCGIAYLPFGPR